jgi:hypothetical protein
VTAYTLQFNADGTLKELEASSALPFARLVVATAGLSNNIPQFNKAQAVRGILIRRTGAITMVNDANAF